ncbi:polysaccharide deacetylase family protein [Gramella sp. KN1008]|uniref:polysaccharide deacetylase family protein n=1 Tax=Gramella sp. KN1008 TaxID=2529298 RepID=UPI00103BCFD5|nr:polysaccharide deacetylase family protein [Gramella sp. KN1008]TBW30110.1 polysaccharide deacetylase family protein [Gramella sp. KN1008]
MKFFWPKYPALLKWLYPNRVSRINNPDSIYLTFDDGPVPEVTPWVLDLLKKFNARGTFFCIGDNVEKHPDIFRRIIEEGHAVGNHTHKHLNGWKTSTTDYLKNIEIAEKAMLVHAHSNTSLGKEKSEIPQTSGPDLATPNFPLFRPPYGKIKNSQAGKLRQSGYRLVMWDVISGDYDKDFSPEKCYRNVTSNAVEGSTIVFHDSKKAFGNLQLILPKILEHYNKKGFEFRSLKDIL